MKKLLVPILTMLASLVPAGEASAFGFGSDGFRAQWAAYYPNHLTYLHQTQTCYRPEWREDKVDIVVPRWHCKEVVEKIKVQVMVPKWEYEYCEDGKTIKGQKCHWTPEDRVLERRRQEWFATPENVTTVRRYCVMVPYTTETCVPVLLPHYGPPVCPWAW